MHPDTRHDSVAIFTINLDLLDVDAFGEINGLGVSASFITSISRQSRYQQSGIVTKVMLLSARSTHWPPMRFVSVLVVDDAAVPDHPDAHVDFDGSCYCSNERGR